MKTRNNVQKAARKFTVVIASIILMSLTVGAQDFWNETIPKYQYEENVFALAETIELDKPIELNKNLISGEYLFLIEEVQEEALELENWMCDETIFNAPTKNSNFILENENEEKLVLENWMVNDTIWNNQPDKSKSL